MSLSKQQKRRRTKSLQDRRTRLLDRCTQMTTARCLMMRGGFPERIYKPTAGRVGERVRNCWATISTRWFIR